MRCFSVLLLMSAGTLGFADSLYLKDGRVVTGTYLGGTARVVRMDVGSQVATYVIGQVARIEFQAAPPPPPRERGSAEEPEGRPRLVRADPGQQTQASRDQSRSEDTDRPRLMRPDPAQDAQAQAPPSLTIPSGTLLKVRMVDGVDSETSQLGQTFQASLDDPVIINGQTVIPRGADVVAKLVEDKQSGKISGKTELTLDLASIRVNDKMVNITTGEVSQSSGSRGAKSAKVIGGATAVGAVLGGIFGGGKGAAIGAASGAGAGTGVQVLTKGQRVKIPAETRLSFTLTNDLNI
jgi:hypothetical protein